MEYELTDNPEPEIHDQTETLSELLRIGKDEMNFAEFPLTMLSDRPSQKHQTSLKFEDKIYDDRKKKLVPRKRVIEGSQEYGLPTATDDAVILALIQLTKLKNGFAAREVDFTRHELIEMLQWPNKGQSYQRIALSLHRVAGVTYHFENSWWDNKRKTWTTKIFGILDTVELNDSRSTDGQSGLFPSRIIWNQIIFDSFQAGYLRTLDFQLCMSLKHAISMRIYRFMGKRFFLKNEWKFDLKDFAYEHIGLSRGYEGGTQIIRKLQPALTELELVGFLEPQTEKQRFAKKGQSWTIRLVAKTKQPELPEPASQSLLSALAEDLFSRGVSKAKAEALIQQHGEEAVRNQCEYLDFRLEKEPDKIKDPAAWLIDAIQNGHAAPKNFMPKAERQRRQAKEREAAEKIRRDREREREEAARKDEDRQAVDAYLKGLTPDQRATLEKTVLDQADPQQRESYDNPIMKRYRETLMLGMLREYLAPELRQKRARVNA